MSPAMRMPAEAEVRIQKTGWRICMKIKDNGKGFHATSESCTAKRDKRLGLLGMRERVEMVRRQVHRQSAPGKGTTVSGANSLLVNGQPGGGGSRCSQS